MNHLHFIVNPAAGGSTCIKRFAPLENILQQKGISYSSSYSEHPGHGSKLTRDALAGGADCVISVGGDGTVREIAMEMLHTGIPMGILPLGTGNDLIRALNIPKEPEKALAVILEGQARAIDAAMANEQLYINVAGFGFDVEVLEKARYYKEFLQGLPAYILGLLHALLRLRSHKVIIQTADGQREEKEVILVSAGNGTHIGGGMMVTPKADVSDGLLDICVVDKVGRLKVLNCLAKFVKGKHIELEFVHYSKVKELTVLCNEPTSVQLDGEIIEMTPVCFRILPGALTMVLPAQL